MRRAVTILNFAALNFRGFLMKENSMHFIFVVWIQSSASSQKQLATKKNWQV